ncbi:MAG TPA: hypothetical protein VIJ82_20795 [Streptosporangiaceae bacterium]
MLSACGTASPASTSVQQAAAAGPAAQSAAGLAGSAAPAADAASAAAPAVATPAPSPRPTAPPSASTSPPAAHLPPAGNPTGHAYVPPAARAVNTSHPTHVIGRGTPASCTSAAVVRAVAKGGVITFNCGPNPVTITMRATAKVVNTSQRVVLDGGGKVILSGGGQRRILYMNTCDPKQVWTTSHCQDQATPRLTVQNLTLENGNATGSDITGGSGGAVYAEGGLFKVVSSRFINNRCYPKGPDLGGAAIRAFEEWQGRPVYIVHSTFTGGVCSNGGALSSIGVSWTVLNSLLARNHAIGWGANPASAGAPGGGSGGAIYNDGDAYTLTVAGTIIRHNHAREGGGAIFFVSNNLTGTLHISHSVLHDNPSAGFHNFPGTIFYLGHGQPVVIDSRLDG